MTSKMLIATAGMLLAASGPALADGPRVVGSGDGNVSASKFGQYGGVTPDWDNFWVSEQTVQLNKMIYDLRDQIAMTADWDGVSPQDLGMLLRAPGESPEAAEKRARRLIDFARQHYLSQREAAKAAPAAPLAPGAANGAGADPSNVDVGGDPGALPNRGGADNRSLARANLWPGGVIPYTFSDQMVNGFFFPAAPPTPEEVNSAAGVSNALAVMLLLEQDTPLIFVPWDPAQHTIGGFLLWENTGDGENPPPIEDLDDADTFNLITRIGVSPQPNNPAVPPTTINHGFWQNFPSMIRSVGFALGLDWEQRHPDRDTFIEVHWENIPPAFAPDGTPWPRTAPTPPGIGPDSPGFPFTGFGDDSGTDLFIIRPDDPTIFPVNAFDLDSMMFIDDFAYNNILPMYTIRDQYRYIDLNGDNVVNMTPGGPDDRQFGPEPVYFSEGDLEAIATLYQISGDLCPGDMDGDGQITEQDIITYIGWYNANDIRAELTGDVCTDANSDGIADNDCIDIQDLVQFFVNLQQSTGCDRTVGLGGDNTIQPI